MLKRLLIGLSILVFVIGLVILNPTGFFKSGGEIDQKVLHIGVLPDETEAKLRDRYKLLFRHLESVTGLSVELIIPDNYSHLLELFDQGKVDVGYFGGLTFLNAHKKFGAVPLAMRDTDLQFRSYFLARADRPEKTINDFMGKRLAFGATLSTSGHLMPRHFLINKGINPDTYFSEVKFSGAHDKTGLLVFDGSVDLGAANASIIDSMFTDGRLPVDDIKIIWRTPPYPDYVWAARDGLTKNIQKSLISAFLILSLNNGAHAEILNKLDAGGFLPASVGDFQELQAIAENLGML